MGQAQVKGAARGKAPQALWRQEGPHTEVVLRGAQHTSALVGLYIGKGGAGRPSRVFGNDFLPPVPTLSEQGGFMVNAQPPSPKPSSPQASAPQGGSDH